MGVDDVEGVVGQVEGVYVAHDEVGIDAAIAELGAAEGQRLLVGLQGGDPARGHPLGEVGRDRPGSGADVEQLLAGPQVRQQVAAGVLGGPPAVRAEHRLGVPVGVAGRAHPVVGAVPVMEANGAASSSS